MNLLLKFHSSSIRNKIVTLIMLVVACAITVALGLMLVVQYLETKQVLVNETRNLARIIANRSSLAVSFMDEEVAMESLNALEGSQNILQANIYNPTGDLFVSYGKAGVSNIIDTQQIQEGVFHDFSVINVTERITENNEVLGYLFLQSDLSPVWSGLRLSIIYASVLYILCLLISLFLSIKLQRYFTIPILSLLDTSKRISIEHNYEIRADKARDDEVGVLVDQFNEMLELIDRHEKTLRNSNEELEWQVEERTKDLADALKESKAANHAKSVFLSCMSHELRTPLNAINGYSQLLLRQQNFSSSQRKQLDTIYKCGGHLLSLINDVLDYSHIEAGQLEVTNAPFNLLRLLRRVSDMMQLQADQKDLYFEFLPSVELPETVSGDSRRISQVLLNILSNAIKYTKKGIISFRVYPEGASHVVFEVEDSGVGIAKDQQEKIFSAFFRASKTEKMVEGLGLGMAISKEYVSLMKGEIQLESEEDVGSTFRVRLPLKMAGKEELDDSSYTQITGYKGRRRKLLLVDDNISNLSVLVALLEPLAFDIHTIEHAAEVYREVEEFEPDALLLDLRMPNLDGVQVIKDLEGIPYKGKVIGISASAVDTNRKNSFVSKCDNFLKKPINADELVNTLQALFNLEWELNSELSRATNGHSRPRKGDLKPPSDAVIQELRSYTEEGNFAALASALQKHCEAETEYLEFYKEALAYAEDFDDESLLKLFP